MRKTYLLLAVSLAFIGSPVLALERNTAASDLTKIKPVANQPVLQANTTLNAQDLEPKTRLPNLDLATGTSGSGSNGSVFKPLPFNPPIIPPELINGPQISGINLQLDSGRLKVAWTTDKPATGKIVFGSTEKYGTILENATMATSHELILSVAPGELHFKISSADKLKNESTTPDMIVDVPGLDLPKTQTTSTGPTAIAQPQTNTIQPASAGVDDTKKIGDQKTSQTPSSITATDAALGGAAILFLGILVGIFLPRNRKVE